jgi:hypothetical protein
VKNRRLLLHNRRRIVAPIPQRRKHEPAETRHADHERERIAKSSREHQHRRSVWLAADAPTIVPSAMKELAARVWAEPAVFIGLLVSLGLLTLALLTDPDWDASTILGIIAPVASALGIRPLVTPTHKGPPHGNP